MTIIDCVYNLDYEGSVCLCIFNCYIDIVAEDYFLSGDADGDGAVNIKDATAIQKHSAGIITLAQSNEVSADTDGNASVNVKDATAIQKHIANIETGLDIGWYLAR